MAGWGCRRIEGPPKVDGNSDGDGSLFGKDGVLQMVCGVRVAGEFGIVESESY